jgi:hypothetical protein
MMKLRKALVIAGLVSVFAAPAAFAGVNFSAVGVGNLVMPSTSGATISGLSGGFGYGGGALVEFNFGRVGLELGGIYRTGSIKADGTNFGLGAGTTLTASYNQVEIPVNLNIWLSHIIYLDAGGYFTDMVGAPSASVSTGAPAAFSGWGDLNQNTINYGLQGGLGFHIPFSNMVALRLEARYQYQLNNSYNSSVASGNSWSYNGAEFLAGLTFGGGMMMK